MNNKTQEIIQKTRRDWILNRYKIAIAKARSKAEGERTIAELTMILDDMQAEGHDIQTPIGLAIFTKIIASRIPQLAETNFDFESWPKGW